MRPLLLLPLLALACQTGSIALDDGGDDTDLPDDTDAPVDTDLPDDTEDTEDTDAPVDTDEGPSPYEDAELVVRLPLSGAIYPLATGFPYDAYVADAQGDPLPFQDLEWTIRGGTRTGLKGDWAVPAGIYTVDVEADLPNGDRLRTSIGGVRVQHPYAGIWTGSVGIATFTEVQGQIVRTDCVGSLDFAVDMAGQALDGQGGCTLAIPLVGTVDLTYGLSGDIAEPQIVNGTLGIDIPFLQIPVPFDGGFPSANRMQGAFTADLFVTQVEGELEARKVTPYVQP